MPREPPTTRTWPAVYLLSRDDRRGTSARISGVTRRCSVSAVRAGARVESDPPRVREAAHELLRYGSSRALHHRDDVVARLGSAHLLRRVERLELSHRTRLRPPARAPASASSRGRPSRRP